MALSKSLITGRVPLPTDENLQFAELTFALSGTDTEGADVLPGGISKRVAMIDSDIPPGFDLWQNTAGLHGTHYRVLARWTVKDRDGVRDQYADLGIIQVGASASYTLADLINTSVPAAIGTFWSAITQAQYDEVIAAAASAAAAASTAALYDGPKFNTSQTMLASTNLAYAAAPGKTVVAAGDIVQIRGDGASYQVQTSDAPAIVPGYPFILPGGLVKLRFTRGSKIMPENCKFTGAFDDTDAMQLWANVIFNDRLFGEAYGSYNIADTLTLRSGYPGPLPYLDDGVTIAPERYYYGLQRGSKITFQQNNQRGVILQGRGLEIPCLDVGYASPQGISETESYGICYRGLSFSWIGSQRTENACLNGTDASWSPSPDNYNNFFSNTFEKIWVRRYGIGGFLLSTNSRFSSGNTIGELYIEGLYAAGSSGSSQKLEQTGTIREVRAGASYALSVNFMPGLTIRNLNIERASAGTGGLLRVADSTGVVIDHLHFEGIMAGVNDARLIRTVSGAVKIGSLDLVDVNLGLAYTESGQSIGFAATNPRLLDCSKYEFGFDAGNIDIGQIRTGGRFRAAASALFASTSIADAIAVENLSDEVLKIDLSPIDWTDTPKLFRAAMINADGTPKTANAPYVGGPATFMPVRKWQGREVIPYARAGGVGGTQTTAGIVSLIDTKDRWNLHSGGLLTAPVAGMYELRWRMVCQASGSATVSAKKNGSTTLETYEMTRTAGVPAANTFVQRTLLVDLAQGDTVGLYLDSGGVAKDSDTFVEFRRVA